MKKYLFLMSVFIISCSTFQNTNDEKETSESSDDVEEVYVFDEVSEENEKAKSEEIKALEKEIDNTLNKEKTEEVDIFDEPVVNTPNTNVQGNALYYLQLGAFSSLKNAEEFAAKIESEVPFNLSIIYSAETTYYNVRSNAYSTRNEVEQIKNDLFKKNVFKDAFIVTEQN